MAGDKDDTTRCYTWNGHGNLGDDWIGEVCGQYFPSVAAVREKRSLNPLQFGRHRLDTDGEGAGGRLVLWGGGWMAADRPGSRTISAWARHLRSESLNTIGFGLGVGPFSHATPRQLKDLASFLDALDGRLAVRTVSDLQHLPAGRSAELGCDAALLDKRFYGNATHLGVDSDFVVFSFPSYSLHWVDSRSWMTEEWYLRQVNSLADQVSRTHRIVFVEFDRMLGLTSDSAYWGHLPAGNVVSPASIEEAAALFRSAHKVYAGRLHAAILGAVVGIPTMAIAYHHKFEVVAELGIPTAGLVEEPTIMPEPVAADRTTLSQVRNRGLEALAAVNW